MFLLWILAVILVWGIVTIIRGNVVLGIVLIIVGLLVGPGGVSIFNDDDDGDGRALAAAPESLSGCNTWKSGANGFNAQCDHGTTYYQATAQCYGAAGIRYEYGTIVAPSPSRASAGICDLGYSVIQMGWRAVV